jgi:hypothetical protein
MIGEIDIFWMFPAGIVLIIGGLIASPFLITWWIISARKRDRANGIPPWRFSTRSMLIAITIAALLMGFVSYMVRNSFDPTH